MSLAFSPDYAVPAGVGHSQTAKEGGLRSRLTGSETDAWVVSSCFGIFHEDQTFSNGLPFVRCARGRFHHRRDEENIVAAVKTGCWEHRWPDLEGFRK